jgi:putative heme-binding domain-containing protein
MGLVLSLCLASLAQAAAPVENVSSFPPRSPAEERKALHVPPGFEVQLVAAEPDIQKPFNIAFDDRGRLWVTGSVEYPFPAKDDQKPRDTVRILEDFQPNGRAGKITVFAEGLNIPIGILPLPTEPGALVYSIPTIDRIVDTDGDGRADRRQPFYQSYGSRDTHGMTNSFSWGFDGWIYACHGFSNTSSVSGKDKASISMQSGNVYRMKLDGSHAEYYTHGQVNPFGLSFDPLGNLYSSDCHSQPIYLLLRGAYYPSFGKPDDGLGFGPAMMAHNHGSTAIDGATYYAAESYPADYRGTVFLGNVVTNRVNHDRLEWHGSTPRAIAQTDFIWSEDNWFRPVDIELGPDGALYIADFYNRIIGHYEVPLQHPGRDHDHGRIWRIVYRGKDGDAKVPPAPSAKDLTKAAPDELIEALGDSNLAVRTKASNQLALRGDRSIAGRLATIVAADASVWRRVHALWVLERLGQLEAATLAKAAADPARELRVHAMRVIAEEGTPEESLLDRAREALGDRDPLVARCAAEALGQHPAFANLRPLLKLRQSADPKDTHLLHMVRMALRDQFRPASAWERIPDLHPSERDARDIADVAPGVPTPEAAAYLMGHIKHYSEPQNTLVRYVHHIARYGTDATGKELVAYVREPDGRGPGAQAALLKTIQQGTQERGAHLGDDVRALALDLAGGLLGASKADDVTTGLGLAAGFKLGELTPRMESIAQDHRAPVAERNEAVAALVAIDAKKALGVLGRVLADVAAPLNLRERAAQAIGGIDEPQARDELLKVLPTAPGALQMTIASGLASRKPGAEALLQAIAAGKASARILQNRRVELLLVASKLDKVEERIATLLKGLPPADRNLDRLMNRRRTGYAKARHDLEAGARVFEKNCAACHQIGGKGARVGPQLDGVGTRGLDRLVEDILDPNRNVDQAFRITNLALKDGQVVSGLLLKEEGAVNVLADSQGKEVRVPSENVEERSTSQLSLMPANLPEQISEAEFYNLLGFLLSQQEKKEAAPNP